LISARPNTRTARTALIATRPDPALVQRQRGLFHTDAIAAEQVRSVMHAFKDGAGAAMDSHDPETVKELIALAKGVRADTAGSSVDTAGIRGTSERRSRNDRASDPPHSPDWLRRIVVGITWITSAKPSSSRRESRSPCPLPRPASNRVQPSRFFPPEHGHWEGRRRH